MLPKAILFDLDDTIISFDGATDTAWEETCCAFVDAEKPDFDSNTLLQSIQKTRKWYWSDPERHRTGRLNMIEARRDIVRLALKELEYANEVEICRFADHYSQLQKESIRLFPNSIDTLEKLKSMGQRLVLITNGGSDIQRWKINKFNLEPYFEFCLVEEEVGFGKPDLRVFQLALDKLGLSASDVWMVGDNLTWDVEAPQKLGIFSIWNDYRKRGLPENSTVVPDRIIHEISELIPG